MKNKLLMKIFSFAMALLTVFTLICASGAQNVSAGTVTLIETINIASARENMKGHGYEWDNINKILTLDGINLSARADYGLRLPADCTVILKGKNFIKAEKHAVSCAGNVTFKGDGSLQLDAGENGFYLISQDNTTKVKILSGKYMISAGKHGVLSEYTDFSLVGGKLEIEAGERAILGRVVNLVGGEFSADASVEAAHILNVDGVDISIDADRSALIAKNLTVKNVKIDGADEYAGENFIHAKAEKRWHQTSFLFGENVAGYFDFIALAAVLIAAAGCIMIPIAVRRKKKRMLFERLAAEGYIEQK